jgi:hypothetical protein
MKQVTRNIDLASARDLLQRVPRACIAFADADRPLAQPVKAAWRDERFFVGIPENAPRPAPGQEAVLLIDEGIYYYDLRAVYLRGHLQPAEAVSGGPPGCVWFEILPTRTMAWDYGMLREVDDERG